MLHPAFALQLPEYDTKGAYFLPGTMHGTRWYMDPEAFIQAFTKNPTRGLLDAQDRAYAELIAGKG